MPSKDQPASRIRRRLLVLGVVQGVGFRPYVYRLARGYGLTGFVRNTALGAIIEVEGTPDAALAFGLTLPSDGPPLMRISSIESEEIPLAGDSGFEILESETGDLALAWVPADVAVCADCSAETGNPGNRRFEYPFTNCTNCGPRYCIILDVPYDRTQTTLAGFPMCARCRAEYENPSDRRFHAQPIACPDCGPHLWMTDNSGNALPLRGTRAVLEAEVDFLRAGRIVAWKGLGGYQLVCDARNDEAVRELRQRKHRNEKAFAVMVADVATAESLCEVSERERALLNGAEKPIVLLVRNPAADLPASVAPGNPALGVMLPYTPMHELLFRILDEKCGPGSVLVMTSGNMSEEPILIDEADAQARLSAVADAFVHHNRPIHTRVDDSVVRVIDEQPMVLRRARGYAPAALRLGGGDAQILACGAQQKSALCLTKGGYALMSQHLGDLENYETLQFFEQTLERMRRLFHVSPQVVVNDLHPAYLSTQFAKKQPAERHIGVQHHHAHIASCMAEHELDGQVIGVAWDGTGYGTDGTIWGGEFLIADRADFERFAHLRNVTLAGGDAAVREPWRVARSYLRDAFGSNVPDRFLPPSIPEKSVRMLDTLIEKRLHTFETSSCGRLFDAVAAMIGLHQTVSFEGQAAITLEAIADSADESYEYAVSGGEIDLRPMVLQIADEVQRGESASRVSARFHNTLVALVGDICERIRQATGLNRVCLSGGCFQNRRLLQLCLASQRARGFEVYFQRVVPTNDGGIALGQAAVASELLRRGV